MARAYLKIWTRSGHEGSVREALLTIDGVKSVDLTAGEQDIIAVVEADTYEDVLQIVVGQIRPLHAIERTVTNLAL
ncbi:MAG TPA: Lrp/AsnC ligand binding domain-containing protein [Planctomycetota bacterium]|nr:Lrp/AsnC ligand binding domain-containing protein [Planctomycetota bacterium]